MNSKPAPFPKMSRGEARIYMLAAAAWVFTSVFAAVWVG